MKRYLLKKTMIIAACLSVLFSTGIQAAVIDAPFIQDLNKEEVTIKGTIPNSSANTNVAVEILKPMQNVRNIHANDPNSAKTVFAYTYQTFTDASGNYIFQCQLPSTNDYVARVWAEGRTPPDNISFHYSTLSDRQTEMSDLINKSHTLDSFQTLFNNDKYVKDLYLNHPLFANVNRANIAPILYNLIKNSNIATPQELQDLFEQAVIIEAANEGKLPNLAEYYDKIRCDPNFFATYNLLSAKAQQEVLSDLAHKGISDPNQFNYQLYQSIILRGIENKLQNYETWSAVDYILSHYENYIGIDSNRRYATSSNKDHICEVLVGRVFSDFAALKEAYYNAYGQTDSSNNTGGTSGGGNGGGSTIIADLSAFINPPAGFSDLGNVSWAVESINGLVQKGIINGTEPNCFEPDAMIKREEFVKMIVLALKLYQEDPQADYNDVQADAWYYRYIACAQKTGLIKGMENGNFGVGTPISREEMAAILYRAVKYLNINFNEDGAMQFADHQTIDEYARNAVYAMKNEGIINGMGNNYFAPQEMSTRAQAAKMLYGFLNAVERRGVNQ